MCFYKILNLHLQPFTLKENDRYYIFIVIFLLIIKSLKKKKKLKSNFQPYKFLNLFKTIVLNFFLSFSHIL